MAVPRRVFLSHTSELREFPDGFSFAAAAESAVSRTMDAATDMKYFAARDNTPAKVCRGLVRDSDIYVGIIGLRYGSPVVDEPEISYTELEFNEATEAGLVRLLFLLDDTKSLPIPAGRIYDRDRSLQDRQEAFRKRIENAGIVIARVSTPEQLERDLLHALYQIQPSAGPAETAGRALLPEQNLRFTGREEVLAHIADYLQARQKRVLAIHGLGGVGKTQVALEYAHRSRRLARYQIIGWVRADSQVTMAEDLALLASDLGLATDERSGQNAHQVVDALESRQDWLLVFDNADDHSAIKSWLPNGSGHVLITSRSHAWRDIADNILNLDVFRRLESVNFLCNRTGDANRQAAGHLAENLGDLALALAQAAAFIEGTGITIADYRRLYQDPDMARQLRDQGLRSRDYEASVARTWQLNFGKLQRDRPAAVDVLRLCAFLDPDDIDLELLAAGAGADQILGAALADRLERIQAVGALLQASLVQRLADERLRVHRLVQDVTRDQLGPDEMAGWVTRTVNLLGAVFPDPKDARSWPVCARLAPHAQAVISHVDGYPGLAVASGNILNDVAIYLVQTAQFSAAQASLERALAIQEAALGPDHAVVAKTLGNLSSLHAELNELDEAQRFLERALAIYQATDGPDGLSVGMALGNLGIFQARTQRLPEAHAALVRAVAIKEAHFGPHDPRIVGTLSNLGTVQRELGDLDEARASQERALAIVETSLGPADPAVASPLANLAEVQRDQGNLSAALTNLTRAASIAEVAYGPDNPQVAGILLDLGDVQHRQGDNSSARSSAERAVAIFETAYEPGHPDLARARQLLGIIMGAA